MKTPRGNAGTDLFLFILFIVILGVVWAYTGGPERSISREGPFLNPPFPLGSGEAYTLPTVSIPSLPESSGQDSGSRGGFFSNLFTNIRSGGEITEEEERSPHAAYVSLSVSNARNTNVNQEYLTIKTASSMTGTISISDWRLESTVSTNGARLGAASYLPISGEINAESPVAIGPNTTVYVTTGRSPLGVSFRTNRCTGFLGQFQTFTPSLSRQCPEPNSELATYATRIGFIPSDECLRYVGRIRTCSYEGGAVPQTIGDSCRSFVQNELTYNGCVTRHKNQPDFYRNEWRLFLDRDQELWREQTDRIRLLDEAGRVIDVVSY